MKKSKKANGFDSSYYTEGNYDDYLKVFKKEGKEIAKELTRIIKPQLSWRFLDIGCGMGGVVLALREMGCQAYGTEISRYCLKNSPAKKWLKGGNVLKIPFKSKTFEVVICRDILCYLNKAEQKKALSEMARVAKNYLFLETICKNSPNASQKKNPDKLRKDKSLPTEKQLLTRVEKLGFKKIKKLFGTKDGVVDFNYLFKKYQSKISRAVR